MKRHESLVPLSREHHGALILAQLIKRNAPLYKGLPETIADKKIYALNYFKAELKSHFKKEEAMLKKIKAAEPALVKLADEIVAEHQILSNLFLSLKNAFDPQAILNEIGNELDAHIRKEERVLFPLIQKLCPEKLLQQLTPLLAKKLHS
jgi:iron-sulfur cluster repair protein YtfE (RIC family)